MVMRHTRIERFSGLSGLSGKTLIFFKYPLASRPKLWYNMRRLAGQRSSARHPTRTKTKKGLKTMSKELKIGDWYYRMMGYGGSDSQMCCIRRKTGEQTAAGMLSLFNGTGVYHLAVGVTAIGTFHWLLLCAGQSFLKNSIIFAYYSTNFRICKGFTANLLNLWKGKVF